MNSSSEKKIPNLKYSVTFMPPESRHRTWSSRNCDTYLYHYWRYDEVSLHAFASLNRIYDDTSIQKWRSLAWLFRSLYSSSMQLQYWTRNGFLQKVSFNVNVSHSWTNFFQVGWLSASRPVRDVNAAFQQSYDQTAYGAVPGGDIGVKARLVDLISAVRTLMRSE